MRKANIQTQSFAISCCMWGQYLFKLLLSRCYYFPLLLRDNFAFVTFRLKYMLHDLKFPEKCEQVNVSDHLQTQSISGFRAFCARFLLIDIIRGITIEIVFCLQFCGLSFLKMFYPSVSVSRKDGLNYLSL